MMKTVFLLLAAVVGLGPVRPNAAASDSTGAPTPHEAIDRTMPPKAGPLPPVNFPNPATETLPNGMRVRILPSHREPTVTFRLLIKSGGISDGSKPGLAGLTADLLNKGTPELTADQFANQTDFMGASVEGGAGDDSIEVTANGLSKYTSELLGCLRDAALRPAFREEELKQEKLQTVSALIQKKSDPEDLADRLRDKLIFGKHPYGAFPTPESVQAIAREDVVGFHDSYFRPNNATLIVVGDVDPDSILAAVKKAFGDWKSGAVPSMELPSFPPVAGISYHLVDRPGSVQSNIVVAARGIARNNPDVPELNVVNCLLGGGMSGRLFMNLREQHGYTYGAYSGFQAKKLGGTFSATAEVRNAVTAPAIGEIVNELNRLVNDPIPDSELRLQRNYLAGNFLLSLESNARTAERIQDIDLFGLPPDYFKTYAERVTAVTPEKASEIARKYIDPKNLDIVVVGEAKEVLPQLQKLGKVTVYNTDLKAQPESAPTP